MARAEAGLIRTLQTARDVGSRALAAAALGDHCSEQSRKALIHALETDRHDAVRISAVQALRQYGCNMGAKGRTTIAQAMLQDRCSQVRSGAAFALGGLGSSATQKEVRIVCDALRNERHCVPVRAACVQTLGQIFKVGGQLAAAALTHAFWEDGDKWVRAQATDVLQKMAMSLIQAGAPDLARRIQAVLSSPKRCGQLSYDWLMPGASHWNQIVWSAEGSEKAENVRNQEGQIRKTCTDILPGRREGSRPLSRSSSSSAAAYREAGRPQLRPSSSPGTTGLPGRLDLLLACQPLSRTTSLPDGWEMRRPSSSSSNAPRNGAMSRSHSFVDHFPGPPNFSAIGEASDFDDGWQQAVVGTSQEFRDLDTEEQQRPALSDFDRASQQRVPEQRWRHLSGGSLARSQAAAAWPTTPMRPWTYPAKSSSVSRGWRSHTIRSITQDVSDVQCEVCLQDLVPGQELRVLPCLHQYHVLCIDEWCDRCRARGAPPTCPVCRAVVTAPQRPSTSPC